MYSVIAYGPGIGCLGNQLWSCMVLDLVCKYFLLPYVLPYFILNDEGVKYGLKIMLNFFICFGILAATQGTWLSFNVLKL
jgi:hypothetical protein